MMLSMEDTEFKERKKRPAEMAGRGEKEERMLHRLFDITLGKMGTSGFDGYLAAVQRHGKAGAPTADEARRDYQATVGPISISITSFTD